jgi:hypothetical protein
MTRNKGGEVGYNSDSRNNICNLRPGLGTNALLLPSLVGFANKDLLLTVQIGYGRL